MLNLRMMLCSVGLMLVAGCSSKPDALCQPRPNPPAPAAWAMQPPSNSLMLLDATFSVSDPESSATRKN